MVRLGFAFRTLTEQAGQNFDQVRVSSQLQAKVKNINLLEFHLRTSKHSTFTHEQQSTHARQVA